MDQTPIVSLASGHPLIDIDLTAVVQFVLFLLVYVIANKLLFKPYLALRERRKAGIDGARAEAERMTATADAKLAGEEGRKVRLEAAAHEKDVTDKARSSAQKAIDEAQATMRSQTDAARAQLLPQADALARSIASKLLGREVV